MQKMLKFVSTWAQLVEFIQKLLINLMSDCGGGERPFPITFDHD